MTCREIGGLNVVLPPASIVAVANTDTGVQCKGALCLEEQDRCGGLPVLLALVKAQPFPIGPLDNITNFSAAVDLKKKRACAMDYGVSTPKSSTNRAKLSAVELRRKRDKERYALLSAEQKESRNKKAREYKLGKEESQGHQSATTTVTGNEVRQLIMTPRRLPFTDTYNVANNQYIEYNDVPLSCIIQGTTENTSTTDYLHGESVTLKLMVMT
uniref:IBB domain-containing protein n=1 Tax=Leersia perrieri TaxID=77586 RepID=A0A0D9XT35_9ORYZ